MAQIIHILPLQQDTEMFIIHIQYHGLTLIPAFLSNHMPSKVWDEITNPFPNFNGVTIEVWKWIRNFI